MWRCAIWYNRLTVIKLNLIPICQGSKLKGLKKYYRAISFKTLPMTRPIYFLTDKIIKKLVDKTFNLFQNMFKISSLAWHEWNSWHHLLACVQNKQKTDAQNYPNKVTMFNEQPCRSNKTITLLQISHKKDQWQNMTGS